MRKGFKVTPSIRKKINILALAVGCPLNWHRKCGVQWNTKDVACKGEDASNIIHDIAHYAVATKAARKVIDFGLGAGPSSVDQSIDSIYSGSKCDSIERRASALGIYWEKKLGLNWESTAEYHSWTSKYGRFDSGINDLKTCWHNMKRTINKYDSLYLLAEKMKVKNK